jgi:protein tyrosine/serine phosphatase
MNTRTRRNIIIVVSVVGVIAVALVTWNNVLKAHFVARNFSVVEPGSIYRSGQISQYMIEKTLKKNDIRTIIFLSEDKDLTQGVLRPDVTAERETAKRLGIERFNFPLRGDGTGNLEQYANAIEQMVISQRAFKPVLVHCHAGAQRTGAAMAFYHMLIRNRPISEVYEDLLADGHDPEDNPNLIPYVNENIEHLADMLVERGILAKKPDTFPKLAMIQ